MSTERARPYRKRRRADQEARTRLRITQAAVDLHGTIGPARTTITRIAAKAGVQRATVYHHFPDSESLFLACSAHWASLNPPPEPTAWSQILDPEQRLCRALDELYAWYEWAEPMLTNVLRDAPLVPAMASAFRRFQEHFAALHGALLRGRPAHGRRGARVSAALGHAIQFETWQSLTRVHGLSLAEAAQLMVALVATADSADIARQDRSGPPRS